MRILKIIFPLLCLLIVIGLNGTVAQAVEGTSGIPKALPLPIQIPNLPENFNPSTVSPQRMKELEKKYGDQNASIKELQKRQQDELKAKRETVKNVWKMCQEKIASYRKTRLAAAKALRESSNCKYQPVDTTLTGEAKTAAQKQEIQRLADCRKTLLTTLTDFEKETRLQVIVLQKSCSIETQKPVVLRAATSSANVRGIETDEVPVYDFTTQVNVQ
ncbi:MAG: hypothetical protein ABI758_04245 [Candidatus Woesebacteria bacterium]